MVLLAAERCLTQKKALEEARDGLGPQEHFYYAEEFNLGWMPTLKRRYGDPRRPAGHDPDTRPT
jgi:hypothetical protein